MILVAGLVLGLLLAVGLGGRLSRLLKLSLSSGWTVGLALGVQIALFSRLGDSLAQGTIRWLHIATYALLALFLWRNRRIRILFPLALGMALNAVAIVANGGKMPLSRAAAASAGLVPSAHANVSFSAHRLAFSETCSPSRAVCRSQRSSRRATW